MIERTFPENAEIEVSFQWDNGDPSVGIGADWGEETGALVKAGPVWTFIHFEPDPRGTFNLDVRRPVSEWLIDEIQVNYIVKGDDGKTVLFVPMALTEYKGDKQPTLGKFPRICEAVESTWEQFLALEALEQAGETCWGLSSGVDEYEHLLDPEYGYAEDDPRRADIETKLAECRNELEAAKAKHDQLKAEYNERYGQPQMRDESI